MWKFRITNITQNVIFSGYQTWHVLETDNILEKSNKERYSDIFLPLTLINSGRIVGGFWKEKQSTQN
jgi:hypothetical protein